LCKLTNPSCQQKETSQALFLYKPDHGRTKLFQAFGGRETSVAPGPQDDNKNAYQANIAV